MSSAFGTNTSQLQTAAVDTKAAVGEMLSHARAIRDVVEVDLAGWDGEAKMSFLNGMGINLPELQNLNTSLENMATNLGLSVQGVTAMVAEASRYVGAASQGDAPRALPGLNFPA
jgi:uncharacterized protein YukE